MSISLLFSLLQLSQHPFSLLPLFGILTDIRRRFPRCLTPIPSMDYGRYFDDDDDHYRSFKGIFRCHPVTFINKPHLEQGDKIIMPPSALDKLAYMQIEYPIMFKITNPSNSRTSHCGVMEFVADEGLVCLPQWMMQNMLLKEGDLVNIETASLSKATYVKLQPHTMDFLDISNPKAVLETTLRNFSCLTTGDTIVITYNNKQFHIDIVETKPSAAVSIIETDCEVDFAPPLDYKEPEKPKLPKKSPSVQDAEEPPMENAKFSAFTGSGRRLDGKPSSLPIEAASSAELKEEQSVLRSDTGRRPGKLVFGSATGQSSNQTPKDAKEAKSDEMSRKDEKAEFQAFTGKKYTLR